MVRDLAKSIDRVNLSPSQSFQQGMMLNVIAAFVLSLLTVDLHDPAVHGVLTSLLRNARYGSAPVEEAAFLMRDANGATYFLRWRPTGELHRAQWSGPLPPGTVAIIHTHPNWLPQPSNLDARVARETSLPVYVVTLTRISRTDGGKPELIVSGDWSGS